MKLLVLLLTLIAVTNAQNSWLERLQRWSQTQQSARGIKCWECDNARTNDACLASGKVRQCDYNQGSCQNTIRVNHGRVRITKGCKQTRACRNNQRQNNQRAWLGLQCNLYPQNIVCFCCCESDKCNDKALYCRGNTAQSLLESLETDQPQQEKEQGQQQQEQQQQQQQQQQHHNDNNDGQQYVGPQSQNPCHTGSPCGNGATCVVGDGVTYTCQCAEGFTDSHCNTPVKKAGEQQQRGEQQQHHEQQQNHEQQQQQNNNNNNMNENNNQYLYGNSQKGFEASHKNPCEGGLPCGNGGTCVPGEGLKYTCQCPAGWGDANCNTKLNPTPAPGSIDDNNDDDDNGNTPQPKADLNENPHGINHGGEGYTGPNRNPCEDGSPCGNGGTCVAGTGYEYSCTCPPGWGDANCNTPIGAAKMTTEATTTTTEATTTTTEATTTTTEATTTTTEATTTTTADDNNDELIPGQTCWEEGEQFMGTTVSTTASGRTCDTWSYDFTSWHMYDDNGDYDLAMYDASSGDIGAGTAGNYCRNYNENPNGPYCFVGATYVDYEAVYADIKEGNILSTQAHFEYCDIPKCPKTKTTAEATTTTTEATTTTTEATTTTKADIDECASSPCQNGGICTDGDNAYSCSCAAGFSGGDCSTNNDECASSPCQNGGICTDGDNAYSCSCADGFSGGDCSGGCVIEVYQHGEYEGARDTYTGIANSMRRNDDMTSFKLTPGCCVALYEHGDFEGSVYRTCEEGRLIEEWNDRVSSLKVYREGEAELTPEECIAARGEGTYFHYNGYIYEATETAVRFSAAITYCEDEGGVLAWHNLDTLEGRRAVADGLGISSTSKGRWYNLRKKGGQWQRLDGTPVQDADIHWATHYKEPDNYWDNEGSWKTAPTNAQSDLVAFGFSSSFPTKLFTLCEYTC